MSARIRVDLQNARELAQALRETIPTALDTNIQFAVQTVGDRIADDARNFSPVRTGFLRSTIELTWPPGAKWVFYLVAKAPYAAYVEWGTRRMEPRLFMTRALELHAWELTFEIEQATIQTVNEALI